MKLCELHAFLEEKIPAALSCEWDNDGLLVCPDAEKEIKKVLVALDATKEVALLAIQEHYDLILTHHPIIFSPLSSVEPSDPVAKKVIALLGAGVSVMSYHTRLDAVKGGVNDLLAETFGLVEICPFGQNGETVGRIGRLQQPTTLEEFAKTVKKTLSAATVSYAGVRPVEVVALLGGGGSDDVEAAHAAGADTFLSGELKYHQLNEAPERGMNLVAAGHFDTEKHICKKLASLAMEADPTLVVKVLQETPIREI